mmetsp:Transcript_22890/g.70970  ORF Transcript_22890/g.70970 Transcript_22890/m.70970 type:complete len:441 (-) Transcript_22890:1468-2790(-)
MPRSGIWGRLCGCRGCVVPTRARALSLVGRRKALADGAGAIAVAVDGHEPRLEQHVHGRRSARQHRRRPQRRPDRVRDHRPRHALVRVRVLAAGGGRLARGRGDVAGDGRRARAGLPHRPLLHFEHLDRSLPPDLQRLRLVRKHEAELRVVDRQRLPHRAGATNGVLRRTAGDGRGGRDGVAVNVERESLRPDDGAEDGTRVDADAVPPPLRLPRREHPPLDLQPRLHHVHRRVLELQAAVDARHQQHRRPDRLHLLDRPPPRHRLDPRHRVADRLVREHRRRERHEHDERPRVRPHLLRPLRQHRVRRVALHQRALPHRHDAMRGVAGSPAEAGELAQLRGAGSAAEVTAGVVDIRGGAAAASRRAAHAVAGGLEEAFHDEGGHHHLERSRRALSVLGAVRLQRFPAHRRLEPGAHRDLDEERQEREGGDEPEEQAVPD